ncbi:MAG TPA: prolyl oligopeptidase family serine peptidase [Ignavibacteria bacterium]|nr:prolyl oligopeptidase family serine peptidase [Ignavibacteria bacterium]
MTEQIDDYFGTKIADPYRWLEKLDSKATTEWVEAQNKVTFDYLSEIPFRGKIKQRLTEIWNYPKYSQPFKAGSHYFYYKNDGLQNQSVLYFLKDLDAEPEVFLDPNTFSTEGTISLDDVFPSNDGKYLAYSISKSGSDWKEIFVIDIESRKKMDDHIDNVKFSGANWYKDGFFYNKFEKTPGENEFSKKNEFSKVYYHKLGTLQDKDILIFEDTSNPESFHGVWANEDEKYIFLFKSHTGKKGNAVYIKKSPWTKDSFIPISENMEYDHWILENYDNKLYMYTNENAPNGKVVMADIENLSTPWTTIIDEKPEPLSSIKLVGGNLIAVYLKDVNDKAYVYGLDGKLRHEIQLPSVGNVGGFDGKKSDKTIFYSFTSMIQPPIIYRYNIEENKSTPFRKSEVKFNPEDYESKQVFYTSKDETKIPMFIIHKKGLKLDGKNPAYLYGYGGFGNSMTPYFSISRIILLENGGVFAMPNIRGGNEYGEKWHEAGMVFNKQNVFDDFIFAADYLIKEGYTSQEKLAVAGGSNGGLLVGAVVNQRPDLFKVSLPSVGVMDMLRFHKFTIGAAWKTEYGSSDDPEQFKYLLGYSPLHNIRQGVEYPATLVTTADHDDRVVPSHSFKYIATLQSIYKGSNPVLIRVETKAGHGLGKPTTKIIEEITDVWAFMFYNMGLTPEN